MMINGKPYSYYGFVPIIHTGFLDMPARLGETYYDWGDHIEPLVHEDDIFWQSKQLVIEVLFDQRLTSLSFRQSISELTSHKGYMFLQNIYGSQEVKFKDAHKKLHPNDNIVTYRLVFDEFETNVDRTVNAAIGGSGILIDGYSLARDFGVLVQKVEFYDDVASLKTSKKTSYNPKKELTDFRTFKYLQIRCTVLKTDGYIDRLKDLKSILGAPDMRKVVYNGVEYTCFFTDGFKVTVKRGLVTFSIKLNVMSQLGLFDDTLFAKGLFYEGNTRKYLESLFEYNLFGTGIFQR